MVLISKGQLTLKNRILSLIPSRQIRDYLESCFEELHTYQLAQIILYANAPLTEKSLLMRELSQSDCVRNGIEEEKEECGFYAEMLQKAVSHMEFREEEKAVFLLNIRDHSKTDDWRLYTSFSAAVNGLKSLVEKDLDEHLQRFGEAGHVYFIEKWLPGDDGRMKLMFRYIILGNGVVTHAEYGEAENRFDSFYDAVNLNLPLPFQPGDIVRVDCRPYAPVKYCLITEMGDNRDCCCVQCMYADDRERGEDRFKESAFKHSFYLSAYFVPIAPLLNSEVLIGNLPDEDSWMLELVGKA